MPPRRLIGRKARGTLRLLRAAAATAPSVRTSQCLPSTRSSRLLILAAIRHSAASRGTLPEVKAGEPPANALGDRTEIPYRSEGFPQPTGTPDTGTSKVRPATMGTGENLSKEG